REHIANLPGVSAPGRALRLAARAMKLRILFLDHADFLGGAEQSELELLRLIDGERFELALACPEGALANAARAQRTRVNSIDLRQVRGAKNALSAPFRLIGGVRALV